MNMLNANTAFKKRSHGELTVPHKQEIIDFKKKFPKLTQKELIEKFSVEYKTVIPKSTMSDILKPDYGRKLKQLDNDESYNKRVRDAKYPELEKCLYLWNCEMLRKNLPVADDLMHV
jgi:CRISPR/Cas system-associated protein Cas5 (RAMP superfamily)